MFEAGQHWLEFAGKLETAVVTSGGHAQSVWTQNTGGDITAFQNSWTAEDGPEQAMSDGVVAAYLIGAALIVAAIIVLILKIIVIVQLIFLAIRIAIAIAAAIETLGASLASIPPNIAATRVALKTVMSRIIKMIRDGVVRLFKHAAEYLRKLFKKFKFAKKEFKTTAMDSRYAGEHLPGNKVWPGSQVHYLDDAGRQQFRLFTKDGKLYDANGNPFDTSLGHSAHSGGGKAIFVMDKDGNLYASNFHSPGQFHHSSFLGGKPVASAGELSVRNGKLVELTDRSGHYKPAPEFTNQALSRLKAAGIVPDSVSIG
ncbi:hypothetical protein [Fodinicola acaciae]|uniref:hypothetical protein n=1 Tax=Fodinicola acaciae TaxID=2681555 RepID=UPI0013D6A18B|nr:hypothetical protein [Fodinicola acaciae]